jgi:hypothetical protein
VGFTLFVLGAVVVVLAIVVLLVRAMTKPHDPTRHADAEPFHPVLLPQPRDRDGRRPGNDPADR